MADKKGLQKIGLQIPKIVLKAAGNDPKRLKKIRDLFGKKKQLKFPGMKIGGGVAKTAGSQSATGRIEKSGFEKTLKKAKDFYSAYKRDKAKVQNKMGGGMMKYNKGGDAKIKKVISGLHKASALHKGQAKSLESVVKKSTGGMADYYKDII
jgi:hypothetical protein